MHIFFHNFPESWQRKKSTFSKINFYFYKKLWKLTKGNNSGKNQKKFKKLLVLSTFTKLFPESWQRVKKNLKKLKRGRRPKNLSDFKKYTKFLVLSTFQKLYFLLSKRETYMSVNILFQSHLARAPFSFIALTWRSIDQLHMYNRSRSRSGESNTSHGLVCMQKYTMQLQRHIFWMLFSMGLWRGQDTCHEIRPCTLYSNRYGTPRSGYTIWQQKLWIIGQNWYDGRLPPTHFVLFCSLLHLWLLRYEFAKTKKLTTTIQIAFQFKYRICTSPRTHVYKLHIHADNGRT